MPYREINLLAKKEGVSSKDRKKNRRIQSISIFSLFIFLLLLSALFAGSFFVTNQIAQIDQQIVAQRNSIAQLEKNESLLRLLKQKTSAISRILAGRFNYEEIFEYFSGHQGNDLVISNLTILESGEVRADITASNSSIVDRFVNDLLTDAETIFAIIEVLSVNSLVDGRYVLTFEIFSR